jgi:uncharacterized protein YjbJ (UPF0337 family)
MRGTWRHRKRSSFDRVDAVDATEISMMNKQHVKSAAKKVEGAAKEAAGKLAGDKSLELKGKAAKAEGKAREVIADAEEAAKKARDHD